MIGIPWLSISQVAQLVKNSPAMQETLVSFLGQEESWRRDRLPTPVFLPGEFHGQRSLTSYIVHGVAESDTTKHSTEVIITIHKYTYRILIKCQVLVSAIYTCIPFLPPVLLSIHPPSLLFWFLQPHKAVMLTWGCYIASEWRSKYLNPRDLVSKYEVLTTMLLLPIKKKWKGDGKPSI